MAWDMPFIVNLNFEPYDLVSFCSFNAKSTPPNTLEIYMENCKPMDTPLSTNWKKESASLGDVVDATIYRQLV